MRYALGCFLVALPFVMFGIAVISVADRPMELLVLLAAIGGIVFVVFACLRLGRKLMERP